MASEPSEMALAPRELVSAPGERASEPSEEDIRLRAYHRFLQRGAGHGYDFDDWLEAERELRRNSGISA